MKTLPALLLLVALHGPVQAQLRLPTLPSLPRMPGVERMLSAPLPELLPAGRQLAEQRLSHVRELLTRHADLVEADPAGEPVRRQEILLVSPSEAALATARALGMTVLRDEAWDELGLREVVLRVPAALGTAQALARLRAADPDVQADFNHLYAPAGEVPSGLAPQAAASRPEAAGGGVRARVGLIDGGVDRRHPALRRAAGASFGCAGEPVPGEHGTAVASLLVGRDRGFAGAAPQAALYAADVYCGRADGGSAEQVAQALAWMAREQVPVVNLSLVGPHNQLLQRAVAALVKRGHLLVAAVGNDGPAAPPLFPAAYEGVVGVTGVNPARRVLPEAAQGPQVMLAAPGAELAAARAGGGYGVARGTSFAAPWVAGLLALELAEPRPADAAAALERLAASALDLGAPGRDPVFGRGLVAEGLRVAPGALQSLQSR